MNVYWFQGLYKEMQQFFILVMGGTHGTTVYRDTIFSRYQYRRGHVTLRYCLWTPKSYLLKF